MDPVEAAQQAANRGRRVPEAATTTTTTSVEEIVPALIQTPFSATHTNTHTLPWIVGLDLVWIDSWIGHCILVAATQLFMPGTVTPIILRTPQS